MSDISLSNDDHEIGKEDVKDFLEEDVEVTDEDNKVSIPSEDDTNTENEY